MESSFGILILVVLPDLSAQVRRELGFFPVFIVFCCIFLVCDNHQLQLLLDELLSPHCEDVSDGSLSRERTLEKKIPKLHLALLA